MDAIKQAQLKKSRSYTACITEAYRMFFNNIKLVFRHTWIFALACSLSIALYSSLHIDSLLDDNGRLFQTGPVLSLLLMVCANVAFYARVMMLINRQTMKWNTIRCAKLALCGLIIAMLPAIIIGVIAYMYGDALVKPGNVNGFIISSTAVIAIFILMTLPLLYVSMKYLMAPGTTLRRTIISSYKTGLRHWGFIFTTSLLSGLLVTACTMLASMPTLIILTANSLSVAGVTFIGDPTGLPSSFFTTRFITFAATSFISLYINVFALFVYYFIYGSIDTRENEKKEFLKQQS